MSEHRIHCDWLVLPHTPDREAWRACLYEAADQAGRTIFEWDKSGEADWSRRPLILTNSVSIALSIQPDPTRIAVVFGALDVALTGDLSMPERHEVVRGVTDDFAQLSLLPSQRLFGINRFEDGPLEILPGLKVTPPTTAVRPSTALAQALELHLRDTAIWPVEIFSWNSPFEREGDMAVLDLTGRPRFLAFGPYITMPPGRWKVRFRVAFDDYASRYLFRVDWGQVEQYASHEFRPGKSGVYEVEMASEWSERSACEFRFILREGAFHGEVAISDIAITRVA